jgi:hypothetical protein
MKAIAAESPNTITMVAFKLKARIGGRLPRFNRGSFEKGRDQDRGPVQLRVRVAPVMLSFDHQREKGDLHASAITQT